MILTLFWYPLVCIYRDMWIISRNKKKKVEGQYFIDYREDLTIAAYGWERGRGAQGWTLWRGETAAGNKAMLVTANENMSRKRSRKRKVGDDDTENLYSQQHPLATAGVRGLDYNVRMVEDNNFAVQAGRMDSYSSPVVGESSTSTSSSIAPTFRAHQQECENVSNDPLVNML